MMQGVLTAVRSIAFGTLLIVLVLTVMAVLAVEVVHPRNLELAKTGIYDGCSRCRMAYATVWEAVVTFIMTIIAGDSWGLYSIPLITYYPWTAGMILVPTFIVVHLGLWNVLAAVIVDCQQQARVADDRLLHAEHSLDLQRSFKKLHVLFRRMDTDGGGSLTLDELLNSFEDNAEFREMLEMMDINLSDIPLVFDILDDDGSGDVTYDEFDRQIHYLRHVNTRTLLVFIMKRLGELVDHSSKPEQPHGCNVPQEASYQHRCNSETSTYTMPDVPMSLKSCRKFGAKVGTQEFQKNMKSWTFLFFSKLSIFCLNILFSPIVSFFGWGYFSIS